MSAIEAALRDMADLSATWPAVGDLNRAAADLEDIARWMQQAG